MELDGTGLDWTGRAQIPLNGLDRMSVELVVLDWTGLSWAELDFTRLHYTAVPWIELESTIQDS